MHVVIIFTRYVLFNSLSFLPSPPLPSPPHSSLSSPPVCVLQELLRSSQGLSEEREEVRRRLCEACERVRHLEEELRGVSQRSLQKETELDWCGGGGGRRGVKEVDPAALHATAQFTLCTESFLMCSFLMFVQF